MKKFFNYRVLLFLIFLLFFSFAVYQLTSFTTKFDNLGYTEPAFMFNEEFDPALKRLNSMEKLRVYCDSFYHANETNRTYPGIVSETLRRRFYHGYSLYGLKDNFLGAILAECSIEGIRAIVIPDDILKFPYAACSQQSIVGMELFKYKGYDVRKVTMYDSVTKAGHFAYEVFYENGWHFFDTNQEPDQAELRKLNRPSAAFFASRPDLVLDIYRKRGNPEFFQRAFINYKAGPVNKYPAPRAYLFQVTTKYLSYFGWLLLPGILLISSGIRRFRKRKLVSGKSGKQKIRKKVAFS